MKPSIPVRSVKKALDLLDLLVFGDLDRSGIPLTSLAARMGMPANTTHNLLKTMAACGYVGQTPTGAYVAGRRCAEIGRVNGLMSPEVQRVIQAVLEEAGRQLDEALTFAALVDGRRVLLLRAEAGHVVRVDPNALEAGRMFAVPTGRVLAAFADPATLDRIVEVTGFPGEDWSQIRTRPQLDRALADVRARGAEVIAREGHPVAAFAVPVLLDGNVLLGSLGCYAPAFRCGPDKHAEVLAGLRRAAAGIARTLRMP